ncbi:MAG: DUF1573 domain-containing protein [Candidatus Krumholzibacteria bacterium]|nr:DUF1573 domain-containing protein [Candidatus Krumholzibacteria bacterium]
MKIQRKIIAAGLVLLLSAGLYGIAAAQAKPAGKSPKALVEQKTVQVGEILEMQNVEHTFTIKNTGSAELQILGVKPSCGCSVADFDKVIAPGQEGKVHITIDGKKIGAGPFDKTFAVKTNDPENEQFNLAVQGKVTKALEFSKDLRWAGFVDEKLKIESYITVLLAAPMHITGARWDDDGKAKGLDAKIGVKLDTIERGKKYRLTVWKKTELMPESVVSSIVLATDNPKLKEKIVLVSITIMNDVELHPQRLYYGEMLIPPGATKGFERAFNIIAARGDSLKILKAVSSREDMTVKIQELMPGKSYRGTVLVRPTSRIEQYTGSIKIYTNYPKYREVVLDVVGSVRVGTGSEGSSRGKK